MASIAAHIIEQSDTSITFQFEGEPFNVLEPLSQVFADIDWDHTLTVDWSQLPMRWTLEYQHDGFPYHDISLNGSKILTFDPHTFDETPMSLFGSGEHSGTRSGEFD